MSPPSAVGAVMALARSHPSADSPMNVMAYMLRVLACMNITTDAYGAKLNSRNSR